MEFRFINKMLDELIKPKRMYNKNHTKLRDILRFGYGSKNFKLNSFDGLSLDLIHISKNKQRNKTIVVYNHSHGACKYEGLQLLEACNKTSYDLCIFDSRSCGASDGETITFGKYEKIDLLFIIFFMIDKGGYDNVILWGRSIGGCAILQLLHEICGNKANPTSVGSNRQKSKIESEVITNQFIQYNLRYYQKKNKDKVIKRNSFKINIKGVVLDSPIRSFKKALVNFVKRKVINIGFLSKMVSKYAKDYILKKNGVDIELNQNGEIIKEINPNLFLFFSKDDDFITKEDELKLKNAFAYAFEERNLLKTKKLDITHRAKRPTEIVIEALLKIEKAKEVPDYCFTVQVSKNKVSSQLRNNVLFKNIMNRITDKKKTKHLSTLGSPVCRKRMKDNFNKIIFNKFNTPRNPTQMSLQISKPKIQIRDTSVCEKNYNSNLSMTKTSVMDLERHNKESKSSRVVHLYEKNKYNNPFTVNNYQSVINNRSVYTHDINQYYNTRNTTFAYSTINQATPVKKGTATLDRLNQNQIFHQRSRSQSDTKRVVSSPYVFKNDFQLNKSIKESKKLKISVFEVKDEKRRERTTSTKIFADNYRSVNTQFIRKNNANTRSIPNFFIAK